MTPTAMSSRGVVDGEVLVMAAPYAEARPSPAPRTSSSCRSSWERQRSHRTPRLGAREARIDAKVGAMTSSVHGAARGATDHPLVERGARLGYAASGVVHVLLGWLAVQLAWGSSSANADQTGALEQLAENTVGAVLLWVVVLGFVLLGVWQAAEAVVADETKERVKAAAKAVGYLALALTAFRVATGSGGGDSNEQASSITATIMENPLGRIAVGIGGLVVVGV